MARVIVETGRRRAFACALDWPGWCRSGRDEPAALAVLASYAPRYAAAVGDVAGRPPRANPAALDVVERLEGDATTDFGAPGGIAAADHEPYTARELDRHLALLRAAWAAFDAAAAAAGGELRTGPRGGGRRRDAIVAHVLESDCAYVARLGGRHRPGDADDDMAAVRAAIGALIAGRARGEEPPPNPRRRRPLWPPRYGLRRSAWHALDHAWELEDRAVR